MFPWPRIYYIHQ